MITCSWLHCSIDHTYCWGASEGVRGDRRGPILKGNEGYSLHRVAQRIKLETSYLGSKRFALELSLGFPSLLLFFSFKAFLSFNFWEVTVQTPDGNGILSICPDGKGQRVQLSMAWASSCGKRILVKSWTCGIGKVGLLSKSNHGCSVLPDGSSITSLGGLTMLLLTPRTPLFPSKGRVFSLPLLFQEHRCSLR